MTIRRLKGFIEKMRIYSIIATVLILLAAISMGIMMAIDTKSSNIYMLIMLLFIVLLSISLEIMLQALRLRLVSYNNTSYTIYAGVFNYYIFKGEKEVASRYDLHLLTPIIIRYLDDNTLVEAKISPIIKKIELKIDDELIK